MTCIIFFLQLFIDINIFESLLNRYMDIAINNGNIHRFIQGITTTLPVPQFLSLKFREFVIFGSAKHWKLHLLQKPCEILFDASLRFDRMDGRIDTTINKSFFSVLWPHSESPSSKVSLRMQYWRACGTWKKSWGCYTFLKLMSLLKKSFSPFWMFSKIE